MVPSPRGEAGGWAGGRPLTRKGGALGKGTREPEIAGGSQQGGSGRHGQWHRGPACHLAEVSVLTPDAPLPPACPVRSPGPRGDYSGNSASGGSSANSPLSPAREDLPLCYPCGRKRQSQTRAGFYLVTGWLRLAWQPSSGTRGWL